MLSSWFWSLDSRLGNFQQEVFVFSNYLCVSLYEYEVLQLKLGYKIIGKANGTTPAGPAGMDRPWCGAGFPQGLGFVSRRNAELNAQKRGSRRDGTDMPGQLPCFGHTGWLLSP